MAQCGQVQVTGMEALVPIIQCQEVLWPAAAVVVLDFV